MDEKDLEEINRRIIAKQVQNGGTISKKEIQEIYDAYKLEILAKSVGNLEGVDLSGEEGSIGDDVQLSTDEDVAAALAQVQSADIAPLGSLGGSSDPNKKTHPRRVVSNIKAHIDKGAYTLPSLPSHIEGGGWTSSTVYEGAYLVDEYQRITETQNYTYENSASAIEVYKSMAGNPAEQKAFLYFLEDHAFYGNSEPSAMALAGHTLDSSDYAAINSFLLASEGAGLTWRAYAKIVAKQPEILKDKPKSGGQQFSNAKDISYDAHRYAMATLGRPLTKAELKASIAWVQQQQAKATGSEAPASREVLTMEAVRDRAPQEAAVYGLGQALDMIFRSAGKV